MRYRLPSFASLSGMVPRALAVRSMVILLTAFPLCGQAEAVGDEVPEAGEEAPAWEPSEPSAAPEENSEYVPPQDGEDPPPPEEGLEPFSPESGRQHSPWNGEQGPQPGEADGAVPGADGEEASPGREGEEPPAEEGEQDGPAEEDGEPMPSEEGEPVPEDGEAPPPLEDASPHINRYQLISEPQLFPFADPGDYFDQDPQLRLITQPYAERWDFHSSEPVNGLVFRHWEQDLVSQRINYRHDDERVASPYRLRTGSQRVLLSPLTLDRRLQAARLETEPGQTGGYQQSLMWISARDQLDPAGLGLGGHRFQGASWQVERPGTERYVFNVVQQNPVTSTPQYDTSRRVTSFAGERSFSLWQQQDVTAEAEIARLDGRVGSGALGSDRGLRVQMRAVARDIPLEYELRYRRYGEDFAPIGTAVNPDSRLLEARAGWRFPFGLGVRGRYDRNLAQVSHQQLQSEMVAVTFEAPKSFGWLSWLDQSWDLSRRQHDDAWGTVDSRATEARWSLRAVDRSGGTTRLALSWLGVEDHLAMDRARQEHRLVLNHAQRLDLGFVEVAATPGVDYRVRSGPDDVSALNPTLRLDAMRGPHKVGVRLDYRGLDLRQPDPRDQYGLLLDYRYRVSSHTFGVEYEQAGRNHEETRLGDGWRAGMFWRYHFDTDLPLPR